MYKFKIPKNEAGNYMIADNVPNDGRPYYKLRIQHTTATFKRSLSNELHDWMVEHNIKYIVLNEINSLYYRDYRIGIRKKEDAMLFKLTWV
jgi:hypothetical protein